MEDEKIIVEEKKPSMVSKAVAGIKGFFSKDIAKFGAGVLAGIGASAAAPSVYRWICGLLVSSVDTDEEPNLAEGDSEEMPF